MANYSCKKFSLTTYRLATIHSLQTDRQTDGRTDGRTTHDTKNALQHSYSASKTETHTWKMSTTKNLAEICSGCCKQINQSIETTDKRE